MKTMGFLGCGVFGRRQRGLAMVELAIATPLLLLLVFGVGELGRMLSQYNTVVQASRDAARYAAHHALNNTTGLLNMSGDWVGTTVNLAVTGTPLGGGDPFFPGVSATVAPIGGEHIQVVVTYRFRFLLGEVVPNLLGKKTLLEVPLVATTVMRAL